MRLMPEDFQLVVHRRFADPGRALGREDFFTVLRTGVGGLDVRFRVRMEHVLRLSPAHGVFVLAVRGTVGGGDFETSLVMVLTHDGRHAPHWKRSISTRSMRHSHVTRSCMVEPPTGGR